MVSFVRNTKSILCWGVVQVGKAMLGCGLVNYRRKRAGSQARACM